MRVANVLILLLIGSMVAASSVYAQHSASVGIGAGIPHYSPTPEQERQYEQETRVRLAGNEVFWTERSWVGMVLEF